MAKSDELKPLPKAKKPKGESKITKVYTEVRKTITNVYDGMSHLVLAISLVITAYYNYVSMGDVAPFEHYARTIASVVIALTGAWAVVKIFKQIGEKK